MTELQNNNHMILCNLLPAHVAAHFIDGGNRSHMVSRGIVYSIKINMSQGEENQVKYIHFIDGQPQSHGKRGILFTALR